MTKTRRRSRAPRKRKAVASALTPPATRAAGFDCGSYPGDFTIATWADLSPYAFVGFYLDAPCHTTKTFKTWSGKYQLLRTLGLGLAIVYVGYQQDGCGKAKLVARERRAARPGHDRQVRDGGLSAVDDCLS